MLIFQLNMFFHNSLFFYIIMLDDQIVMLNKWLLCLESMCSACRFINSHEQTRGRTKFLQQRQSLAVSAAGHSISRNSVVISTACSSSRVPTRVSRARIRSRATRARVRRHCTIVRRDTCHVANADNAHLTYNYFKFDIILRSLSIMWDYVLMLVDTFYARNCVGIMYASVTIRIVSSFYTSSIPLYLRLLFYHPVRCMQCILWYFCY